MIRRLGLIVTDASPLITLSAGQALDCLTLPGVPVVIPDMVYLEVTQDIARLGASEIVLWARRHQGQVEIVPTEVFAEFEALRTINPTVRSGGRGEQAALEVLNSILADQPNVQAALIYEDNDLRKRHFVRGLPPGVTALSTGDLLYELEAAGRIQSADRVLDVAAETGRNVEALRTPAPDDEGRRLLRERLRPD